LSAFLPRFVYDSSTVLEGKKGRRLVLPSSA